jgi:hypothetical protein
MSWWLLAPGGLLAIGVMMTIVGAMLPRSHVASRSAVFRRPAGELFAAARDFGSQPSWRRGLLGVDLLPAEDGQARFRERSARRSVTYRVIDDHPPSRLAVEIDDTDLPFGGTWTFEFVDAKSGGSILTVTERGTIRPPLFRFIARFVVGYTTSIDQYLLDLGRHFGEDA